MSCIYKITNKLNGKVYVGQTTKTLSNRFHGHCYDAAGNAINLAIKKYGKDNFTIELIVEADQSSLDELECKYILELNSLSPNGYNVRTGGHTGYKYTDEVKLKISKSKTGKRPNRNYIVSEQQRYDISRTLGGQSILAQNIKTGDITVFISCSAAAKFGFQPWNIISCCKGRRQSHKGFKFSYANTEVNSSVIPTITVEHSDETRKRI